MCYLIVSGMQQRQSPCARTSAQSPGFSEMSEREESVRTFMRDLAEALTGKDLREIAELARYFIEGARADGLTIR